MKPRKREASAAKETAGAREWQDPEDAFVTRWDRSLPPGNSETDGPAWEFEIVDRDSEGFRSPNVVLAEKVERLLLVRVLYLEKIDVERRAPHDEMSDLDRAEDWGRRRRLVRRYDDDLLKICNKVTKSKLPAVRVGAYHIRDPRDIEVERQIAWYEAEVGAPAKVNWKEAYAREIPPAETRGRIPEEERQKILRVFRAVHELAALGATNRSGSAVAEQAKMKKTEAIRIVNELARDGFVVNKSKNSRPAYFPAEKRP